MKLWKRVALAVLGALLACALFCALAEGGARADENETVQWSVESGGRRAEARGAAGGVSHLAVDALPGSEWTVGAEFVRLRSTREPSNQGRLDVTDRCGWDAENLSRRADAVTLPEAEGLYTLTGRFVDDAGNVYVCAVEFNVSADAPGPALFAADAATEEAVAKKVDELVAQCRAQGFTTQYDIALWLHDWLTDNAVYDYIYKNDHGPEGVLLKGTGVCDSYSKAYVLLLDKFGIENVRVTSTEMNHAWNMAKIDGVWCHIDVTWDDPGSAGDPVKSGMENHFYFGLNDVLIKRDHWWTMETPAADSLDNYYPIRAGQLCFADLAELDARFPEWLEKKASPIEVVYIGTDKNMSVKDTVIKWLADNGHAYGATLAGMSYNDYKATVSITYSEPWEKPVNHLDPPVAAPDFRLEGPDGSHSLSDYGENGILMIFGRTICGNTKALLNALSGKVSGLYASGVEVLVSLDDVASAEDLETFKTAHPGFHFTYKSDVFWSYLSAAGRSFENVTYPCVFVVNSDAKITWCSTGPLAYVDELLDEVSAVATGNPLPDGGNGEEPEMTPVDAPDFYFGSPLGSYRLSAYGNNGVVLIFGGSADGDTRSLLGALSGELEGLYDSGVEVLVPLEDADTPEAVAAMESAFPRWRFTYGDGSKRRAYLRAVGATGSNVTSPCVFVINSERKITWYSTGAVSDVSALLARAKAVATNSPLPESAAVEALNTSVNAPIFDLDSPRGHYVLSSYDNNGVALIFARGDDIDSLGLLRRLSGELEGLYDSGVEVLVSLSGATAPEDIAGLEATFPGFHYTYESGILSSYVHAVSSPDDAVYPFVFVINSDAKIVHCSTDRVYNYDGLLAQIRSVATNKPLPGTEDPEDPEDPGMTPVAAPDFYLDSPQGRYRLGNYGKNGVVLLFGHPSSYTTKSLLNALSGELEGLYDSGVEVLVPMAGAAFAEDLADIRATYPDFHFTYDSNSRMWAYLRAVSAPSSGITYPCAFVINSDAKITWYSTGRVADAGPMLKAIRAAATNQPLPEPEHWGELPVDAPDFDLDSDRGHYRLSNYDKNGVALIFGASTNCDTTDLLDALSGELEGLYASGVEVLVSLTDGSYARSVGTFETKYPDFHYSYDSSILASYLHAVSWPEDALVYPCVFVIDSDAKITGYSTSAIANVDTLLARIRAVATGNPLPEPEKEEPEKPLADAPNFDFGSPRGYYVRSCYDENGVVLIFGRTDSDDTRELLATLSGDVKGFYDSGVEVLASMIDADDAEDLAAVSAQWPDIHFTYGDIQTMQAYLSAVGENVDGAAFPCVFVVNSDAKITCHSVGHVDDVSPLRKAINAAATGMWLPEPIRDPDIDEMLNGQGNVNDIAGGGALVSAVKSATADGNAIVLIGRQPGNWDKPFIKEFEMYHRMFGRLGATLIASYQADADDLAQASPHCRFVDFVSGDAELLLKAAGFPADRAVRYPACLLVTRGGDFAAYISGRVLDLELCVTCLARQLTYDAAVPRALTTVDAETFSGAAFARVDLTGGNLREIGRGAFADCPNLEFVRIPASVTEIAPDAFNGSHPVIVCPKGSEAHDFADTFGYEFICE